MRTSRPVRSSQPGVHPRLAEIVQRHLDTAWRQPLHPGSREGFDRFAEAWDGRRPLILDSGCGTAESVRRLAASFPDCFVVGVDRSAARLARTPALPDNACVVRARIEDFWRLLDERGVRLRRHYLLYPNPWPKAAHLRRRWHAHPVFPVLLRLGGRLELRANWRTYLQEFRLAARLGGVDAGKVVSFRATDPLTPFERKFDDSGHALYRLTLNLENEA
jgi:tRNA (guanine-N7-)-methyltransferase